jgi:hypothetical protein
VSSVIDYIEKSAKDTIRTPDGLWWRVRRVSNEAARRYGAIVRLMVHPASPMDLAEEEDAAKDPDPAALIALRLRRTKRWLEDEANIERERRARLELLLLGATHVGLEEDVLDPVQLVEEEEQTDTTATPARVWVGRFNPTSRDALFGAIWDLCTDGGAAQRRIERFRRGG